MQIQPLNSRFQLRDGYIEVTHPNVFKRTPFALLEIFVLMAQHPEIRACAPTPFACCATADT